MKANSNLPQSKSERLRITPIVVAIHQKDESPVFGDSAIHVALDDEAAGPFLVLRGMGEPAEDGGLKIELEELREVLAVGEWLIAGAGHAE